MSVQRAIDHFMQCARRILARDGATGHSLQLIGDEMRLLAETPGLIPDIPGESMHHSEATATILHSDGPDGLTLILAKFPETAATPIHDHNSWGVACVVTGHDRYQHFQRLDDGADHAHAELRLLYERELGPKDVVAWTDPPNDIHCQQGIGGSAWELVLFGLNAMALPRRYFDLASGTVREAMP